MYAGCRSTRAKPVNIDGKHERDLCNDHANGLRDIWLNLRHAYHVSWGLSSEEKAAKDKARLAMLLIAYGEPRWDELRAQREQGSNERYERWLERSKQGEPNAWESWGEEEYAADEYTTEEQAWEEIDLLRETIQDIGDSAYRPPTVRARPRTD